ncbi:pentatricopeptide repeat-containing protein At3g24000, mitochondrial [Malania oleifera]|uniref:pentatricopeptide repeat-containing protein At3g24000, mitochondrial n=1 Tax=Malania oleifera TaxID=397392 RepID=UPI0025AD9DF5|nr:pentatricopeptide repeat-containing protein At3g24000, mitochondrial [Malania oleifera]
MYSKLGRIDRAHYVFDEMSHRNEASWNTMMSGYVRVGLYGEALGLFSQMRDREVEVSGFVAASLITACNRSEYMVNEGLQIHCFVLKMGLLCDVFVGTSLLHFYGTYGFASQATKFFEEMPDRNVVSWTSLMVGYINNGDPEKVFNIYQRMRREGIICNQNTFATIIRSCVMGDDECLGSQLLGQVLKSGLVANVSVANSLVSMFGSFACVREACYVFHHMIERDTVSWNSMISAYAHNDLCKESLDCFHWMRSVDGELNATTLSSLLSVCSTVDNVKWGRGLQGLAVKLGLDSNICVCNNLLTMYSESGRLKDAELLFREMPDMDLISWNSMMACYARDGKCLDALKLLAELFEKKIMMNHVTFASALAACSNPEFITEGKIIHAFVILSGLHNNLIIGNTLLTMYGKFGMMGEAKRVSQTMPVRDTVTWNALIGGHAENEKPDKAVQAFKLMREENIHANYITIVNVLGACLDPEDLLKIGMPVHAYTVQTGFEFDDYVKSSLISMYAKCHDLNSSKYIFDGLDDKTSVTWNVMIAANAHQGSGEEALKLFAEMQNTGAELDQFSFSGGFAATAKLAILEEGKQLHSLVIKLGFNYDIYVTNAAMDMYGKCGEINDVLNILPPVPKRSRLSWNILISSFARHGHFEKAREAFQEMLKLGSQPDHVTFVSLLSACNHGGLVDEGLAHFASMTKKFGVPHGIEHCVCIIDLLGRAGRLYEAESFIKEMPVPPNDLVWRSLLAASRIHGNLELGKKAAKHLVKLDPSDDSAYVLYSNVCAATGRWEEVENVRRQMHSIKVKKKPACSWVKLKNKVTTFGMGDQSNPQFKQIYSKLEELMKKIREAGYAPDTSFALHDTDEEQKEYNLWNHSERLALAFGLINTPEGLTVKIFKNLRVCGDCHSVYKFVSKLVGREIILRDPYRFHHFKDGKCSCGDYW